MSWTVRDIRPTRRVLSGVRLIALLVVLALFGASQQAPAQPVIGGKTPLTPYCEGGACAVLKPGDGAGAPKREVIHLYTPQSVPYPDDPEKRRENAFYSDLALAIRDIKSDHESEGEHKILVHAGEHKFETIVFREEPKSFTIEAYPGDEFAARLVPETGRCFDFAPWDMPGSAGGYEIRFRNLTVAPATGRQLDVCISAANVSLLFDNAELSLFNHYGTGVAIETDELQFKGGRLLGMRAGEGANEFSAAGAVIGERARLVVTRSDEGSGAIVAGFATGLKISGAAEIGDSGAAPGDAAAVSEAEETVAPSISILKPPPPPKSVDLYLNRTAISFESGADGGPAGGGATIVRNASFSMDLIEGSTGVVVDETFPGALEISDARMSGGRGASVGVRADAPSRGAYRPAILVQEATFERLDTAIETAASLDAYETSFIDNKVALSLRYSGEARPTIVVEDGEFRGNDYALELAGAGSGALQVFGAVSDVMKRGMDSDARNMNDVRLLPDDGVGLIIACSFGSTKSDRIIRKKIEGRLKICER